MTKHADPFTSRIDLDFRGRLECWEVRYFCSFTQSWHWERCAATRRIAALKQAPAAALKLIRDRLGCSRVRYGA